MTCQRPRPRGEFGGQRTESEQPRAARLAGLSNGMRLAYDGFGLEALTRALSEDGCVPEFIEFLADGGPMLAELLDEDKQRLSVRDARGRNHKLAADKILFRHRSDHLQALATQVEALQAEVDVPLLWEAAQDETTSEQKGFSATELALLFFSDGSAAHASAIFRALLTDKFHFRRRGDHFEARAPAELDQLRNQRAAEVRAAAERQDLVQRVKRQQLDEATAQRLERFVRGQHDRPLDDALSSLGPDPKQVAFRALLATGHLPHTADFEAVVADLRPQHPRAVVQATRERLALEDQPIQPRRAAFSIDDADTREVDDALSVSLDGELLRLDVDIANAAHFVSPQGAIDDEAAKRAATVYLPTQAYYMLPEAISAERASLHTGQARPALRTSAWFDAALEMTRFELRAIWTTVERRLSYEEADRLLNDPTCPTGKALCQLQRIAAASRNRRIAAGALEVHRMEWKVRVDPHDGTVEVARLDTRSPSRRLVAEMMILANTLAARFAQEQRLPLIYRVQAAPTEQLPAIDRDAPGAFAQLRGLISPASLSLHAGNHWGLGLPYYTQVTSPLRRYGDLVQQRQLLAAINGGPPPYDEAGLLRVLANVDGTERENRRLEGAVNQRWMLEFLAGQDNKRQLEAIVLCEANKGYRVQLVGCGAQGTVVDQSKRQPGQSMLVDVDSIRPRQGLLRLKVSR